MELARQGHLQCWPVADDGKFCGMVNTETMEQAVADGCGEWRLADLAVTKDMPHIHADQPLHTVLERMSASHLDVLPVVHRADVHKLEGIVTLRDVLDSYGID
jgi:predicted transcriptional regulator